MSNTQLGYVDGRHYTTYVEEIKQLKRENRLDDAIIILKKIVEAVEHESKIKRWGVPPWYYEQLAIIYRKKKESDKEYLILKRYANIQYKNNYSSEDDLIKRLRKIEVKY